MIALVCPRDGQVLGARHGVGRGRYECPRCDNRWAAHQVVVGVEGPDATQEVRA